MKKVKGGQVKQEQIHQFDLKKNTSRFDDRSIPEEKVILDKTNERIDNIESGNKQLTFEYNENSTSMIIKHSFKDYPTVKMLKDNVIEVECSVFYTDANTIEVHWNIPNKGVIIVN